MGNFEVIKSNLNVGSFIQVSNYVVFDKNLTSVQYHMFCILSSFCYGSKESCFPSLDTLSKLSDKDPRTVTRIINDLTLKGYVIKKERPGSSNIYILTYPDYITKKVAQKLQDVISEPAAKKPSTAEVPKALVLEGEIFEKVKLEIKSLLGELKYDVWIEPLKFIKAESGKLFIKSHVKSHIQILIEKYKEMLEEPFKAYGINEIEFVA